MNFLPSFSEIIKNTLPPAHQAPAVPVCSASVLNRTKSCPEKNKRRDKIKRQRTARKCTSNREEICFKQIKVQCFFLTGHPYEPVHTHTPESQTGKGNVLVRIRNCLLDLLDQVYRKADGFIFRFLSVAF